MNSVIAMVAVDSTTMVYKLKAIGMVKRPWPFISQNNIIWLFLAMFMAV